jgi:hypothetical protein
MQRGLLRWQEDRMREALPAARAVFETYGATLPAVTLTLARALAADESGHDEATALLEEMAENSFGRLPRGTFWASLLVISAETAYLLDLPEVSERIRDLLAPFADQVAFTGSWVTAPIAYGIGIAMAGCNDPCAGTLLRQAADIAERLEAPVLLARALEPRVELRRSL